MGKAIEVISLLLVGVGEQTKVVTSTIVERSSSMAQSLNPQVAVCETILISVQVGA